MKRKLIGFIVSAALAASVLPSIALADGTVTVLNGTTVRIEAENYVPSSKKVDDNSPTRYSGGYAAASTDVNISVNVPKAGTYAMIVSWGNQYTDNSGFSLTVNGNELFSGKTGKTYGAVAKCFTVQLNQGDNTIVIKQPAQGRVDYIEFPVLNSTDTVRFEAEEFATPTAKENASNGKFSGNTTFSIDFNVVKAGKYLMNPGLGTNSGSATSVTMKINNNDPIVQTVAATWGGINTTDYVHEVELNAGINTFAVTQSSSRIDYIEFVPVTPPEPTAEPKTASTAVSEQTGDNTYKVGLAFAEALDPSDYQYILFKAGEAIRGGLVDDVIGHLEGPTLIAVILENSPSNDVAVKLTNEDITLTPIE